MLVPTERGCNTDSDLYYKLKKVVSIRKKYRACVILRIGFLFLIATFLLKRQKIDSYAVFASLLLLIIIVVNDLTTLILRLIKPLYEPEKGSADES